MLYVIYLYLYYRYKYYRYILYIIGIYKYVDILCFIKFFWCFLGDFVYNFCFYILIF